MKIILLFTSLFFSITFSFSQNLANLDSKYGINKFKLESSYDLYKKDLEYKSTNGNVKFYKVKEFLAYNILGKDAMEIGLAFYKNKLYSIGINLLTFKDKEYLEILAKLENLFGPASHGKTYDGTFTYEWTYLWKTEKVYLGYTKMSWESKFNPGEESIYMISLKLKRQIENESF